MFLLSANLSSSRSPPCSLSRCLPARFSGTAARATHRSGCALSSNDRQRMGGEGTKEMAKKGEKRGRGIRLSRVGGRGKLRIVVFRERNSRSICVLDSVRRKIRKGRCAARTRYGGTRRAMVSSSVATITNRVGRSFSVAVRSSSESECVRARAILSRRQPSIEKLEFSGKTRRALRLPNAADAAAAATIRLPCERRRIHELFSFENLSVVRPVATVRPGSNYGNQAAEFVAQPWAGEVCVRSSLGESEGFNAVAVFRFIPRLSAGR